MKARIKRTDASILLAHAHSGRIEQVEAPTDSTARELQVPSDTAARMARVETLKAQVDAGTYLIDSRAIAQKMLVCAITVPAIKSGFT